jgi:tRNA threonylcarbamoyl adenosine modification protein YeaZ
MNVGMKNETILSIETAIQGGSLSLLANGEELDCWIGQTEVSKAEDVLEQIKNLFERNNFKKESLKLIAVSAGPGSSTGIKIGLSLGKGLSKALGCKFVQVSVMESLLLKANKISEPIVTALPIGKDLICHQVFGNLQSLSEETKLEVSNLNDFTEWIIKHNYSQVICHAKVFSFLLSEKTLINKTILINAEINMARLIATNASDNEIQIQY